MNQSIQFPDLQHWDQAAQMVRFVALSMGQRIDCQVSLSWLEQQESLRDKSDDAILALFQRLRFDIEETVEAMIEDEEFAEDGSIKL